MAKTRRARRQQRLRLHGTKPRRGGRVGRVKGGAHGPLVARIHEAMQSLGERKQVALLLENTPISQPLDATMVNLAMPPVTQGVGQGARIANKIRCTSLILRGHVNVLPFNNPNNLLSPPHYIRIIVFRMKSNIALPTAAAMGNILRFNNINVAFQGLPSDLYTTYNLDSFTIYKKRTIKLGNSLSTEAVVPVETRVRSGMLNVMTMFKFDLTKRFRNKTFIYDDATSICTNRVIYIAAVTVNLDGSLSPGQQPSEIHWQTEMTYTDI